MPVTLRRRAWDWIATPLINVGPLQFGATHGDVVAALGGALAHETSGDNGRTGAEFRSIGVTAYYSDALSVGRLVCVAVDAFAGPRVSMNGSTLTGRPRSVVEQWTWDQTEIHDLSLIYTHVLDPVLAEFGLVIRAQHAGDAVFIRPVFIDRLADDVWSSVPSQEWKIS
ncbi:hypothetical protein [Actinoplanes awajinensis]|uniref:Uncharacterized protein n=1 Tax=Actinoplanes awajinensis subsp. mycoplanecinus TaxID=135947 RepID=A0A101JMQ6_9ACTN|nr:hypothetical protein [Actinoplanes awajinensis]KUL29723.1 hypothetical protein ADL15_26825 [Actinoplanes awajinensis subsp. mycoplanecinus]